MTVLFSVYYFRGCTFSTKMNKQLCCSCSWFVNDGVGIGCAVFTYLLIGYAEFVVVFVMLLPEILSAASGLLHGLAFSFLASLALVAHIRAMVTDPGTIPLGNCTNENLKKLKLSEGQVVLRCTRCECIKVDRAHHCSTCERCVRKMDHHCPWINNCVGEDNQKFFVLFSFYILVISVYALLLAARQLFICTENDWENCTALPVASAILLIIFLVFEGLLFGIFTLVMCCTQVTSICRDETGIEHLKKENMSRQNSMYENLQDVFGGTFSLRWFSPLSATPSRRSSFSFFEV